MEKVERNERIYSFTKILVYKFLKFDLIGNAAQIGFYFILSLLPLLLFIISIIPLFNLDEEIIYEAISVIITNDALNEILTKVIDSLLNEQSNFAISFSIIFTIYSASSLISCILKVIDILYNDRPTRNYLITRLKAIYLTVFFIILLLLSISTYTFDASDFLSHFSFYNILLDITFFIKYLILPVFIFLFLFVCYQIGSNQKFKYYTYLPGTITAIILGFISTRLFDIYIDNFSNYSIQYGTIGLFIIALLWVLMLGIVILFGGLVNAVFAQYLIKDKKNIIRKKYDLKNIKIK